MIAAKWCLWRAMCIASLGASIAFIGGCAGHANLGDGSSAPPGGSSGMTSADPLLPTTVRELPFIADDLLLAGDSLVLSGWSGNRYSVFRCDKERCADPQNVLTTPAPIVAMQLFNQRVWMLTFDSDPKTSSTWIGSYAFPSFGGRQTLIENLPPSLSEVRPLFFGDSAFFFVDADRSLYRCQLPDCANGPQQVWIEDVGKSQPVATASTVFWLSNNERLYRSTAFGHAAVERLQPGAHLEPVAVTEPSSDDPNRISVTAIAAADGMLYAATRVQANCNVGPACATSIVRWPAESPGEREEILSLDEEVAGLFVIGSELVWTTYYPEPNLRYSVTARSCRIESCAASSRFLTQSAPRFRLINDDRFLYWLDAVPSSDPALPSIPIFSTNLVRRAARFPN
jgi:hypothetical protein